MTSQDRPSDRFGDARGVPPPPAWAPSRASAEPAPPARPARPRRTWLVVLLTVVGVLGALVVIGLLAGPDDDGPDLDELAGLCGSGDFGACNELYLSSPAGSDHEAFAESCGGAWEGTVGGACPPQAYGENTALDELVDLCGGGDFEACTDLYASSPAGSEYEAFGESCGGAWEGAVAGACPPQTYGDHSSLDELWDLCETGDVAACGTLYADSPAGSEYEAFGESCGGGGCAALTYGGDPALDPLWDACAAGDMAQCDALYLEATPGSEYETFGSTCGYLTDPLSGGCVGSF